METVISVRRATERGVCRANVLSATPSEPNSFALGSARPTSRNSGTAPLAVMPDVVPPGGVDELCRLVGRRVRLGLDRVGVRCAEPGRRDGVERVGTGAFGAVFGKNATTATVPDLVLDRNGAITGATLAEDATLTPLAGVQLSLAYQANYSSCLTRYSTQTYLCSWYSGTAGSASAMSPRRKITRCSGALAL